MKKRREPPSTSAFTRIASVRVEPDGTINRDAPLPPEVAARFAEFKAEAEARDRARREESPPS